MNAILSGLLAGGDGSPSSMRAAMFICTIVAAFLAIWPTLHGQPVNVELVMTFLGIGVGGKLVQKQQEVKREIAEIPQAK